VYATRVGDRDLTFVVSGMLWQRSLVMMDLQTRSLWSHLLGTAMRGPLKGQQLEMLPSVMTDWETWHQQHPNTSVLNLSRTSRHYKRDFLQDPSRFVIGTAAGSSARAWPLDQLVHQPVVNDQFDGEPILIVFMQENATALAYDRRIDGRTLTFRSTEGKLLDEQTGTQWDPSSGKAIAGPLKGDSLTRRIGVMSYRRAWQDFHPESSFWKVGG
jgi:hypothetical protein